MIGLFLHSRQGEISCYFRFYQLIVHLYFFGLGDTNFRYYGNAEYFALLWQRFPSKRQKLLQT